MSSEDKTENTGASDDMKRKFREALEKLQNTQRAGEAHLDGASGVHSAHGPAGHKREFRRKSG